MPELTGIAARLSSAVASQYRVQRELGVGGMATVFLAHDLKHDREVAIKVLHPELTAALGGERFLSEIKTTARLQHPHILPLLDSGASDGLLYYVMPVVTGESLRARLTRERQLPIDDAVRIAREVASALAYAHRNGIIHRDIKPENILLHEGQALVGDFGIALAVSAAGGERMTLTGISLGTPYYMSPEQAMGDRNIDARSDVYALGAVTFEMLAGEPPFTAPNPQAVLAKVITDKAPMVTASRKLVAPHIAAAVDKALEKLPADRFGSASEFANALTDTRVTPTTRTRSIVPEYWRSLLAIGIAAIVIPMSFWSMKSRGAERRAARSTPTVYDVALPDSAAIAFRFSRNLSIAPSGEFVVYVGAASDSAINRLWYRSLRDTAVRVLAGTEGAFYPSVSPDGQNVVYFAGSQVRIVPTSGGGTRTLGTAREATAAVWVSRTRFLVVHDDGRTFRWFDSQTGETSSGAMTVCIAPHWITSQELVLCGGGRHYAYVTNVAAPPAYRMLRPETSGGSDWIPGSHFKVIDDRYLVWMSIAGELRAARFDRKTLRVGSPVALLGGIRREAFRGEGQFDIASNGTLVYAPGDNAEIGHLVHWKRDGSITRLPFEPAAFLRYQMSPDGRRIAAVVQGTSGHELRIYDVRDGRFRLWLQQLYIGHVQWSPRGDRVLMDVGRDTIEGALLWGSPDNAAKPDTLFSRLRIEPMAWPSDSVLIVGGMGARSTLVLDPRRRPARLDTLLRDATFADISPDGRLLSALQISTREAFVTPFPARNRVLHIAAPVQEPHWVTSTRLRYRAVTENTWSEVDIDPVRLEVVGRPRVVHRDLHFSDTPGWSQRTMPDGGMMYVQNNARTSASYLRVIPNWVEQMKRAVDAADR